jgi:general L-amino acid transport system permease protein
LPLVTILFTVAVLLPIIAPGYGGTKIMRVIAGMGLFFAAYQAEILRSGIQSLPNGQEEAAKALGLSYWQRTRKIVLPQAFRRALPPTVSQFAISFKEVSLVIMIGIFDFLASGNAAYGSGEWAFAYVEVYVFMAFIYFIFVFSLSRYGAYLERRMRVGK